MREDDGEYDVLSMMIIIYILYVTYVREDDGEYDVEYENGTVYTIKVIMCYRIVYKIHLNLHECHAI